MNVKDEQDFNINQLIKHRNDLKLKMDRIKEDMENGLVDDKEKLKYLALMGSQVFKVFFFRFVHLHFKFVSMHLSNTFQKLQNHLKRGKTIIQLIRLCENMELDHQKAVDGLEKKKKFLNYNEDDLKMPPSSSTDQVRKMNFFANEWKEETTQIKTRERNI